MACRLLGTEIIARTNTGLLSIEPRETIPGKLGSKCSNCQIRKMHLNCRLLYGGHFVPAPISRGLYVNIMPRRKILPTPRPQK